MCRTCASALPKRKLLPLFDRPQLHEHYSLSLLSATGLQIKRNDGLSQHVCITCSDTIRNVLLFQKSCETAHEVLIKAAYKRKMRQSTVKIEKSDEFETNTDLIRKNTKISIKVQSGKLVIKSHECDDTSEDLMDSSLIKFESDASETNDASPMIKTDLESLTNYVDVELTPMFDNVESLDNEDFRTSWESNVSGKIKKRAGIGTTKDACGNSKKRRRGSQSFSNVTALMAQYLDETAQLYTCKDCKKSYTNKGSFVSHTQIHTGFKFMCEECSKLFRSSSALSVHQRGVHGKTDITLKCPYCDYYASNKSYHMEHIRKHTGERPYVCDACGASFMSRLSLRQHISSHNTEKTHKCELCPSVFASHFHLKFHRNKVHRPRRWSYQCPLCPKIYNAIKSCYQHMRKNHSLLLKEQNKPIRLPSGLFKENKDQE